MAIIKTRKLEKSESAIASKQNAADKRRIKAQTIAAKFKGGDEPDTDFFNYKISLIKVTNWYNINVELKDIRGYLNDYLIQTERKKLITVLNKASDFDIRYLGILCRLKMRDQYLESIHENLIEERITSITESVQKSPTVEDIVKSEPKVKIDRTKDLALQYSDTLEGAIDDFVKNKKTDFDPLGYLKGKEITAPVAKEISLYYKTVVSELEKAQDDLEESGYGNWKKAQFKKFISFVQSIVDACIQQSVSAKVRNPRKTKPASPSKIVAKVKYAKEHKELSLKSIRPEAIVDSAEVWCYNVKYRKLIVYRAEKGSKLSVKGTTILGFDVKESLQVMLRKPEEFFKDTQLAKRSLADGLKDINTRPVTPNGRINEETILLGAF